MRRRLTVAAVLFAGALGSATDSSSSGQDATVQATSARRKHLKQVCMQAWCTTTHADLGLRQRFAGQ